MGGTGQIELTLLVDPEAQPIAGTIAAPGAEAHAFTGWMELVATLREAIKED